MARRMTKKQSDGIFSLILLLGGFWLIAGFFKAIGLVLPLVLIGIAIVIYVLVKILGKRARKSALLEKYGDETIVAALMDRSLWQGQTAMQVADSIGRPVAIDNKVLKTKKKEIWKYHPQGGNRFNLRVTLENDIVVGWENKG